MSTVCGSRTDGRPSQLAKGRSLAMHDLTDRVCMRLCSSGFGDEPVLLLPVALAFIALLLFEEGPGRHLIREAPRARAGHSRQDRLGTLALYAATASSSALLY